MFIPGPSTTSTPCGEPPAQGLTDLPDQENPRTRRAQQPAGSRSPGGFDQDPGERFLVVWNAVRVVRPRAGATEGPAPGKDADEQ